jgi:hypothetical protein
MMRVALLSRVARVLGFTTSVDGDARLRERALLAVNRPGWRQNGRGTVDDLVTPLERNDR